MDYEIRLISSLEKILPKEGILNASPIYRLSGFRGQRISFQVAYCFHGDYYLNQTVKQAFRNPYAMVDTSGSFVGKVSIRKVDSVPVFFPHEKQADKFDSEYLGHEAGLYPDILSTFDGGIQIIKEQWRALWIDCEIPQDAPSGDSILSIVFKDEEGKKMAEASLTIHVVPASLPKQRLIHTEWFYPDCLADYYGVEVFSEKHWSIIENFMRAAYKNSVNMIFTPIFTPALDTLIGRERTTVQLVRIKKEEDKWSFDFDLLKKWIRLCKKIGFEYFEISHLFTQWGAKFPPKIVAEVNGREEKVFGWHTPVENGDYELFLKDFLPALMEEIRREGILSHTFFHISDEPTIYNADTYQAALNMVLPYIEDVPVIDALSHIELYEKGIVKQPIPTNDYIHEFLDAGVKNAWVYYCCGQGYKVSNRYIAMPAWRNRILGVQLYKYGLQGFLHWGFNFYNCQYSLHSVNPYLVNDGEDAFPAGDPFIVYPGQDGNVIESMRLPVLADAIADIRMLELLESLTDREYVLNFIKQYAHMEIRFDEYPYTPCFLLELWEAAIKEIEKRLS